MLMSKSRLTVFTVTVFSLAFFGLMSFFMYRICGRGTPADGVRPFIVYLLWWGAALIFYRKRRPLPARALCLVMALGSFIITLFFCYYARINSFLTGDDMVAIIQSNTEEQFDFVLFNIFRPGAMGWSLLAALASALTCESLFRHLRHAAPHENELKSTKRRLFASVLCVLFIVAGAVITSQLRPVKFYFTMKEEFYRQIAIFNEISSRVDSTSAQPASKERKGELYVLVIGESLNRDLMGCYNGFLSNTPFMNELCASPRTVRYDNAYSAFVTTMPAITNALSEGNFVSGLTFPEGENLFAVLRRAGVKSAWISNQVRQSRFDTPIAAIADKTDFTYFSIGLSEGSSKQQRPDAYLLPQLRDYLNRASPEENRLIVIHLMGSHSPYDHRYPDGFEEYSYTDPALIGASSASMNATSELNEYLTSVSYNDMVLRQIYEMASARPDFSGFVYLSDHAEEVTPPAGRHNIGQFSYTMTRIPLIISVSENYARHYPETLQNLRNNRGRLFINDTLYDLMLGLMQIKSGAYTQSLTPTAENYLAQTVRGIIVDDKDVRLDPCYTAALRAQTSSVPAMSTDVTCVFDAGLTIAAGIPSLAIRAFVKDGEITLTLKEDREITARSFLKALPRKPGALLLVTAPNEVIHADTIQALQNEFPECRLLTGTGTPEEAAAQAGFKVLSYPSPFDYSEE